MELKRYRETKLQNVNYKLSSIHQQVTIEFFKDRGMMNVDTFAPISLSHTKPENQRATKQP